MLQEVLDLFNEPEVLAQDLPETFLTEIESKNTIYGLSPLHYIPYKNN
jgi:hypothetical protein